MLYDKDNNMQLCLVATKGDMSKNGISDIGSVVLFDNKDKLVKLIQWAEDLLELKDIVNGGRYKNVKKT